MSRMALVRTTGYTGNSMTWLIGQFKSSLPPGTGLVSMKGKRWNGSGLQPETVWFQRPCSPWVMMLANGRWSRNMFLTQTSKRWLFDEFTSPDLQHFWPQPQKCRKNPDCLVFYTNLFLAGDCFAINLKQGCVILTLSHLGWWDRTLFDCWKITPKELHPFMKTVGEEH